MESSHSSTPQATTPPPPVDEAISTPTMAGRPKDYDSDFENWFEESEGASVPTRKGKGKMYQIISSSSKHSISSPPSDRDDSDYEISDRGGEGASSHKAVEGDIDEDIPQGAPRGRESRIPPSPPSSLEPYIHPRIEEWEDDVDWSEYGDMELSSKMVEEIKKIRVN